MRLTAQCSQMVRILAFLFAFLVFPLTIQAQPIRQQRPNIVGGELGGRALVGTLNYERYVTDYAGVGFGIMGLGDFGIFPMYLSLNPFGDIHSLYLSLGTTIALGIDIDDIVPDLSASNVVGTASVGYQYQSPTGLVVRPMVGFLFNDTGFILWPGISIGGSF